MPDRDNVISKIEEEIRLGEHWDEIYRMIDLQLLNDILALLKEQETKTGHWNGPECSRCHAILEKKARFEYCPHCGAKMERD